jgi:hypothetical protein
MTQNERRALAYWPAAAAMWLQRYMSVPIFLWDNFFLLGSTLVVFSCGFYRY